MNIGTKYSDMKMYKGIRHYDKVPLFGEDLNESSDLQANKISRILDNLYVSGILNNFEHSFSSNSISVDTPIILNIKGDICIVKNSDGKSLVSTAGLQSGVVYLIGWYQHIVSSTKMTEYGGVDNTELENDLNKNEFSIQSTSRYQFRWDTYVSQTTLAVNSAINLQLRDSNGLKSGNSTNLVIREQLGNIYLANRPSAMDYAVDDIYIIPILRFEGSSISQFPKIAVSFNYRLLDIHLEHIVSYDVTAVSDIVFTLNVDQLLEDDIFRVTYEGLELSAGSDYIIDHVNRSITLIGFTCRTGERVKVNITRLVEY